MGCAALVYRFLYVDSYSVRVAGVPLENLWSNQYPFGPLFYGDGWSYYHAALNLIKTGSHDLPIHPPLTASLIALIFLVLPKSIAILHGLFALMGAGIPVLTALLGVRWFNRTTGIIAGWLTAISFSQIMLSGAACSEIPLIFLLLTGFLLGEYKGRVPIFFSGLFMGMAILTRTEAVLFIASYLLVRIFARRISSFRPVIFTVAILLTVLPWTVRNTVYYHAHSDVLPRAFRIIPVATNGPINFFIGNGPAANGGYRFPTTGEPKDSVRQSIDLKNPLHQQLMVKGYEMGWDYIVGHPENTVANVRAKLHFWSRGWTPAFFHDNFPMGLRGSFRHSDIWVPDNPLMGWLLLTAVFMGLLVHRNRRVTSIIILTYLSSLAAALIFFGLARQSALLLPLAYLSAGESVRWLVTRIPRKYRAGYILAGAAGLLILVKGIAGFMVWNGPPVTLTSANQLFSHAESLAKQQQDYGAVINAFESTLNTLESESHRSDPRY